MIIMFKLKKQKLKKNGKISIRQEKRKCSHVERQGVLVYLKRVK